MLQLKAMVDGEKALILMKKINIRLLVSFLITVGAIVAMIASIYYAVFPSKFSPHAVQGRLDLSNWSFEQDGVVNLNGEWRFYGGRLLEPGQLPVLSTTAEFTQVPGVWSLDRSHKQASKGSATYELSVLLPHFESKTKLALKVQNVYTSHRLYINGELMQEMGIPAEDKNEYKPANNPYLLYVEPEQQLDIVLQVSNYIYSEGGIVHPIQLGNADMLELKTQLAAGIDLASFLMFLLIGIFHLNMYQMREKETSYLLSGIHLIFTSFLYLTIGEKLFMRLLEQFPFELLYKCQDLFIHSGLIALVFFIRLLDPKVMKLKTTCWAVSPIALYIVLVIATPYSFYTYIKSIVFVYIFLLILVCIIRLFYIMLQKKQTEMPMNEFILTTASLTFVLIALIDSMLYYSGLIDTSFINKLCLLLFLMTLNHLLARRFTNKLNEVQSLSEELQKSNSIKDEFLARTSHEIKTPLHGIMNIADYLLKEQTPQLTAGQKENVALIYDTSSKLSLLVNDLIDAIKLRHEDLKLQNHTVDLYVVTQIVLQVLSFSIKSKNVNLFNEVKPRTFVQADENRLRQIMYNLITNAAKHTEQGHITASAIQEDDAIVLSVTDTGAGIPPDKWELVFNDSYRHSPVREQTDYGMGLGLFISRQLARQMGGELWIASSVPGEGTTFNMRLPLGIAEADQAHAASPVHMTDRQQKPAKRDMPKQHVKRILLVDDEPTNIRVLSMMLEAEYEIIAVYRPEDALRIVQEQHIHLLITDMMMPGMSGMELTMFIRQSYSVIQLPIIIATVRDSEQDIELAYQSGANDYITKPFSAEEIQSRVRILLQLTDAVDTALQNELAFLQAQIKPHFLYNALSNIIALCYQDGEKAAGMLSLLSRYLRYIFKTDLSRPSIPLEQELEIIHAYVEIEKLRFGDRLHYQSLVDPDIDAEHLLIPALLIQPLVENAIRHGLFNKAGQGTVSLSITEGEEFIRIVIADDGIGMSEEKIYRLLNSEDGKGIGIANINKRVLAMPKAAFLIDSELNKGTKCVLFLPKEMLRSSAARK